MKHWKSFFILIIIIELGISIFFAAIYVSYKTKEKDIENDVIKRQQIYDKILDAAAIKPTKITINYINPISRGSPLIFGGAHSPNFELNDIWNQIAKVGVTSIRTDFFIEQSLPSNITLDDYRNNINQIDNPNNWNMNYINQRKEVYLQAKRRGIKTIGIVSYVPKWLTYSNTEHGVPIDWDVYEDIVRKIYSIYRDSLDYLEIWNEPNDSHFLDLQNSGLTSSEAYAQIFYHTAKAVRDVDYKINDGKMIPIGGPAGSNPTDTAILERILQDSKTRQYVNFISYHNYVKDEPSWDDYREVLKKYNMLNVPIFLTEWNYDSDERTFNPNKDSDPAIIYTGRKFLDFLKMGLMGANYYSFLPVNEDVPYQNKQYLGFYRLTGSHAELLPQAKTWTILSQEMALGKGKSTIYQAKTENELIDLIGFTNVNKEQGIVIINATPSSQVVEIQFANLLFSNYAKIQVYYASKDNDARTPVYSSTLKVESRSTTFSYYVPENTIMAVKLTEEKDWFNIFISH